MIDRAAPKLKNLSDLINNYATRLREFCHEEILMPDNAMQIKHFDEETWKNLRIAAKHTPALFCMALQYTRMLEGKPQLVESLVRFTDLSDNMTSKLFNKLDVLCTLNTMLENTIQANDLETQFSFFKKLQECIYDGEVRATIMAPRTGNTKPSKTYGATTFLVALDRQINALAYHYVSECNQVREIFLKNVNYIALAYDQHLDKKISQKSNGIVNENNELEAPTYLKNKTSLLDICIQDNFYGQNSNIVYSQAADVEKAIKDSVKRNAILAHSGFWESVNTFFGNVLPNTSSVFLKSLDAEVVSVNEHLARVNIVPANLIRAL
jgi:hypothetical protein